MSAPSAVLNRTGQLELFGESNDTTAGPQASLVIPACNLTLLGNHPIVQSGDGNTYRIERLSLFSGADQTINSTTPATIAGLSCAVAVGTYRVEGIVYGVQGATAAAQKVQFNGPTASFGRMYIESNADGNTSVTDSNLSGAFPEVHTTPAWGVGVSFYVRFKGIYTFTAAGTFSVQGAEGTNLDTWTAKAASLCDVMPV
jgi:hypothetical protein